MCEKHRVKDELVDAELPDEARRRSPYIADTRPLRFL